MGVCVYMCMCMCVCVSCVSSTTSNLFPSLFSFGDAHKQKQVSHSCFDAGVGTHTTPRLLSGESQRRRDPLHERDVIDMLIYAWTISAFRRVRPENKIAKVKHHQWQRLTRSQKKVGARMDETIENAIVTRRLLCSD